MHGGICLDGLLRPALVALHAATEYRLACRSGLAAAQNKPPGFDFAPSFAVKVIGYECYLLSLSPSP